MGVVGHHYSFLACNGVEGAADLDGAAAAASTGGGHLDDEHRHPITAGEVAAIIFCIVLLAGLTFMVFGLLTMGSNHPGTAVLLLLLPLLKMLPPEAVELGKGV